MKNENQIKDAVREQYGDIVQKNPEEVLSGCCGTTDDNGGDCCFSEDYSKLEGYAPEADYGLGCGLPTQFAQIKEGNVVLDLGSGAGNDAFVARNAVGTSGEVIGVDMTPPMITKARENAEKLGYKNVEFRLGEIENLPVLSETVDVVVSNCVLNLVPDKDKAFQETFRVLKKGGHFSVSDIVVKGEMPDELRNDLVAYAGCISGAVDVNDYISTIGRAGFINVKVQEERETKMPDELIKKYYGDTNQISDNLPGLYSITVFAEKPGTPSKTCC